MKTLFLSLSLLFAWVNAHAAIAGDVVVSTNIVSPTTGIYFESSTVTMAPIIAGTTPADYLVDLYSASSNKKALDMLFQTTPVLADAFGNSFPLTYSFVSMATGVTTSMLDNTWVEIINTGNPSYRDGITSPGYLTISTGPVGVTQVAGSYSTGPIAVDIRLDGYTSTAIGYLTINTIVEEFIVVGFTDTSADTTGVRFVGNDIDFGLISPGATPTPITRDVFVHTNRDSDIKITFANTPSLLSTIDGVSTIGMNYSYSLNGVTADIVAGSPFIATNGTNDGTTSVGTITFTPDTLSGTQVSNTYATTINVVISAM